MVRVLDRAAAIEGLAYLLVMGLGAIILVRGVREPPPSCAGRTGRREHAHPHPREDRGPHRHTMILAIGRPVSRRGGVKDGRALTSCLRPARYPAAARGGRSFNRDSAGCISRRQPVSSRIVL